MAEVAGDPHEKQGWGVDVRNSLNEPGTKGEGTAEAGGWEPGE